LFFWQVFAPNKTGNSKESELAFHFEIFLISLLNGAKLDLVLGVVCGVINSKEETPGRY